MVPEVQDLQAAQIHVTKIRLEASPLPRIQVAGVLRPRFRIFAAVTYEQERQTNV